MSKDVFEFPGYGLYDHERASFERDAGGNVTGVKIASVEFKRCAGRNIAAGVFHVTPLKRWINCAATPWQPSRPVGAAIFSSATSWNW